MTITAELLMLTGGVVGGVVTRVLDGRAVGRAWWSWVLGFTTAVACQYMAARLG
jgi:hypothetical protein